LARDDQNSSFLNLIIEHVHELNFEIKRRLDSFQDEMTETERRHKEAVVELENLLAERDGANKRLEKDLSEQKTLKI